jgi:hypothetical protein
MKEAFDKEMDSLLRRHAGARAEARAGDGARAAQPAAHLDADELSAFAEGSLPADARLAAVSHLSDCDECRGLAVSLASAAGAAGELEKRAAPTQLEPARPARRLAWLSALFAPRVLRYAAPALALCLVAAVSFIAWRSRRNNAEIARRVSNVGAKPSAARAGAGNESDEVAQVSSDANMSANANLSVANSEPSNGEDEAAARAPGALPRTPQAKGPNAEGETPTVTAEEPKRAEAPPPPADEKSAAAAAAPAAKPGANEPTEVAKVEAKEKDDRAAASQEQIAANDQPSQRQQQAKQRANNLDIVSPDDSRNQTRSATNNASSGLTNNGSRSGSLASTPREDRDRTERGAGAAASRRARSTGESRAREEDEADAARIEGTRSAAGHRFRREGGAWVDVNYKPSMTSTGVRRGTDAFRALVADIPEIGRVAEQLGGEVVVVVHGHAYRIR